MKKFINIFLISMLLFVFTGVSHADNYFVYNKPGEGLTYDGVTSKFKMDDERVGEVGRNITLQIKKRDKFYVNGERSFVMFFTYEDALDLKRTLIALKKRNVYFDADESPNGDSRMKAFYNLENEGYTNFFTFDGRESMYLMPLIKNNMAVLIVQFRIAGYSKSDEFWVIDSGKLESMIKDLTKVLEAAKKTYIN